MISSSYIRTHKNSGQQRTKDAYKNELECRAKFIITVKSIRAWGCHSLSEKCLSKNALARLLKLTLTASAAAYLLITSTTSGFKISSLLDELQRK